MSRAKTRLQKEIEQFEKQLIESTIADFGGNKSAAARELGVHPQELYRRLRRLGVNPLRGGTLAAENAALRARIAELEQAAQ